MLFLLIFIHVYVHQNTEVILNWVLINFQFSNHKSLILLKIIKRENPNAMYFILLSLLFIITSQ